MGDLDRAKAWYDGALDVGGGILVATVVDPFDNVSGVIENPHFSPETG